MFVIQLIALLSPFAVVFLQIIWESLNKYIYRLHLHYLKNTQTCFLSSLFQNAWPSLLGWLPLHLCTPAAASFSPLELQLHRQTLQTKKKRKTFHFHATGTDNDGRNCQARKFKHNLSPLHLEIQIFQRTQFLTETCTDPVVYIQSSSFLNQIPGIFSMI